MKTNIALLTLILLIITMLSTACSEKAAPIMLPSSNLIDTIRITNNKITTDYSDKSWIDKFISEVSVAIPTNKSSIQDTPNVESYIKVDIIWEDTIRTLFLYQKNKAYYIEQPYQGIYQSESSLYEMASTNPYETANTRQNQAADQDTIIYEMPQCALVYTQKLKAKGSEIKMWTESKNYWENIQVINVFVENPTNTPLFFGREWYIYRWNGKSWELPKQKSSDILVWNSDAFMIKKAPLLYCFRFPVGELYYLPKGKYRITKSFWQNKKEIELIANFNIPDGVVTSY